MGAWRHCAVSGKQKPGMSAALNQSLRNQSCGRFPSPEKPWILIRSTDNGGSRSLR